ncbi:hypothetical protein EJB05_22331, partial [Eragrostis curvula]
MAASSVQPDHHRGGHPRSVKNRRPLLGDLNVQVPTISNSSIFHPSPKSDRPASPSLLRSPSAWIRAAKSHGFGSGKHTPRPPKNFCYDARSYAQNFDEGGGEEDAIKYRCFSPRLPASPQPASVAPVLVASTCSEDDNGRETTTLQAGLEKSK